MADILKIVAKNGNGLTWSFVDRTMTGYKIILDQPPTVKINDGDVWHVEIASTENGIGKSSRKKTAIVRLISLVQKLAPWEKIKEIPGYYTHPTDLQTILTWLNCGTEVILKGQKGGGKTMLGYGISKALGWQEPYKVDVYTMKRTTDLFGTDAASKGSTHFIRSGLMNYIDRAIIAFDQGLDSQFIVILDEINRVHAKINESLHGLFDDTRQVTVPTSEGSKIITLPPNLHVIGTMNIGSQYTGTHDVDIALKDRFGTTELFGMPIDYEVKKLAKETGITEKQAYSIVQVATLLREAEMSGALSFSPSFRGCRHTAQLVLHGMDMKTSIIKGLLGWYEGKLTFSEDGMVIEPSSEKAKAYSALKIKGITSSKDLKL